MFTTLFSYFRLAWTTARIKNRDETLRLAVSLLILQTDASRSRMCRSVHGKKNAVIYLRSQILMLGSVKIELYCECEYILLALLGYCTTELLDLLSWRERPSSVRPSSVTPVYLFFFSETIHAKQGSMGGDRPYLPTIYSVSLLFFSKFCFVNSFTIFYFILFYF